MVFAGIPSYRRQNQQRGFLAVLRIYGARCVSYRGCNKRILLV